MKIKPVKNNKVRQGLAIAGIAAIIVFIVIMCICMATGNRSLMMASLFCVVVVPISVYCFIRVYDMVHKDDDKYPDDGESPDEE